MPKKRLSMRKIREILRLRYEHKGIGPDGEEIVSEVVLSPLNPEFKPLVIREEEGHQLSVVASFVGVLKPK